MDEKPGLLELGWRDLSDSRLTSIVVASEQLPGYHAENEEQQKYDEGGDEADYGSQAHSIIYSGAAIIVLHRIIL